MKSARSPGSQRLSRHSGPPFSFVQAVLDVYAQRGQDPQRALAQARIRPVRSHPGHPAWPDRVSASQFERFCYVAMQELNDEAPGWFRRRLPWGSYGMLARASTSTPTLGRALKRWCRYHGLLTRDVQLSVRSDGGQASIRIVDDLPPTAPREFALVSLLRNMHGLACWWADSHIALRRTDLPFAAPPHADVYGTLFPGPLHFEAPQAAISFDAEYLSLPVRRDQDDVDRMLQRALPLMVWPYRRDRLLVPRIRRLLQANPAHTAQTLADEMATSQRTLHRQLRAEGQSVQALKNQQRQKRAEQLLQRSNHPIKRIALEAGFASEKSFARAFRAWTGSTPQAWRSRHAPDGQS